MVAPRKPARSASTREDEAREMNWSPPSNLPEPNPEEGYRFKWVRRSVVGATDPTNVSKKMREGWEPVSRGEHPELALHAEGETDEIVVGGLVLCKMPERMAEQRNDHYRQQAQRQSEAVDSRYQNESDSRMPVLPTERKTTVSGFGNGNSA